MADHQNNTDLEQRLADPAFIEKAAVYVCSALIRPDAATRPPVALTDETGVVNSAAMRTFASQIVNRLGLPSRSSAEDPLRAKFRAALMEMPEIGEQAVVASSMADYVASALRNSITASPVMRQTLMETLSEAARASTPGRQLTLRDSLDQ